MNLLTWHSGRISPEDRQRLLRQSPLTLWLTGLSAAGKSTLAYDLEYSLVQAGYAAYVLDGDNVRHGLNRNLGFTPEDRSENVRRIAETARLMNDAGLIVITAFIAPFRADRVLAQSIIGDQRYYEIYLNTPLNVCELRDPKGLYRKARAGALADFTGVSSPYEIPLHPACMINTAQVSREDAVKRLRSLVDDHQQAR